MKRLLSPPVVAGALVPATVLTAGHATQTVLITLVLVALAAAATVVQRRPSHRAAWVVSVVVALWTAVPATRPIGDHTVLKAFVASTLLLSACAALGRGRLHLPRGSAVVLTLFAALAMVTATSPDAGAMYSFVVIAVVAVPTFCLAGTLDQSGRQVVAVSVVVLAVEEAVLAVVEPWGMPAHLWAPAQLNAVGTPVPLMNPFLSGLERSQGTLGHPLSLGLLLLVGLALVVRGVDGLTGPSRAVLVAVLLTGMVFAGARSDLVLALLAVLVFAGRRTGVLRTYGVLAVLGAVAAATLALAPPAVQSTAASGSYLHRVGALRSVGLLLEHQPLSAVLWGNGFGSTPRVFAEGLLQGDGFAVVDNQFVLTLSQGGLLGVALLVAACLLALLRCPAPWRPAVLGAVATCMVFDVLSWPSATALVVLLLGLALSARPTRLTERLEPASTAVAGPTARAGALVL